CCSLMPVPATRKPGCGVPWLGRPTGGGEDGEAGGSDAALPVGSPVVVVGLAGALVGAVPDGVSGEPSRSRCRVTAFVANSGSSSVSTIDQVQDEEPRRHASLPAP